jgi:hypothetical protein
MGRRRLAMAVHHHAIMQYFDGPPTGVGEQEGKQAMQHAGNTGQNHTAAEEAGGTHMLDIGLADGSGMIGEQRHGEASIWPERSLAQRYSTDSPEKILRFLALFAQIVE